MPLQDGEDLADFDQRLGAEHEARQQPPHARDLSPDEFARRLAELTRLPPRPILPVMGGRHIRDLSREERRQAAAALGLDPNFFR
jgi:hypothetical protein